MDISWYLVLSALLFAIGACGVLLRRSPLVILLCLELMLNAGNLALVAFSRSNGNEEGQVFALVVMVVAACEVVVGLGLIVAMFRRKLPLDVDEIRELRGLSATTWAWLVLAFPLAGSLVIALRARGAARAGRRPGSAPPSIALAFACSIGALLGAARPPGRRAPAHRLALQLRLGRRARHPARASSSTRSRSSCAWWSPGSRP